MSERAKRQVGEAANWQISKSANERGDELPEGWTWSTLGEACTIVLGQSPPSSTYNTEGVGLPFYQGKAEFGDTYPEPVKWCSEPNKIAQAGDILISVRAPVGPTNITREKSCIGRGLSAIRPKNEMPNLYFLYFLRSIEQDWERKATGTTFSAITGDVLREQRIPLAPLVQQRRIVDAIETQFTRLDAAVAALERARANLARYRASVLQAACEGRLVPTEADLAHEQDRDYEPADELLKRILAERRARWEEERWAYEIERAKKKAAQAERKAAGLPYYIRDLEPEHWQHRTPEEYEPYLPKSDKWKQKYDEPEPPDTEGLPALPEGWVYTCLEPLLDVKRPGMRTGPFGSLLKKSEHQSTGVPVLGIENIGPGGYVHGTRIHISESKALELAKYDVQPGDILISRSGTVGEVCIVPEGLGIARFSTNLMRVVLMPDGMVPELFRLLFVGDPFVLSQVSDLCSGSTRDFLNQKILSVLIFPLPPLTEQHRIIKEVERRLSVVGALEQSVEANLARAQRLRQAILKKAFEGRLVDQDPDDEPASALLARIKAQREA